MFHPLSCVPSSRPCFTRLMTQCSTLHGLTWQCFCICKFFLGSYVLVWGYQMKPEGRHSSGYGGGGDEGSKFYSPLHYQRIFWLQPVKSLFCTLVSIHNLSDGPYIPINLRLSVFLNIPRGMDQVSKRLLAYIYLYEREVKHQGQDNKRVWMDCCERQSRGWTLPDTAGQ